MKALLQRVSEASVTVEGDQVGAIGPGLLVLVCAEPGDSEETAQFLARKIAAMRIFRDDAGKMNLSVKDTGRAVLAVSQFTLAADWRRGNRPGFSRAAGPELGQALYDRFCVLLRAEGLTVKTGRFGAEMEVRLLNDGPVTIWMDTNEQGT
jgi:D-tyrosyl-tRNA(Tyr) deacylase